VINILRRKLVKALATTPFWGPALPIGQESGQSQSTASPHSMAVNVMRLVNTIQHTHQIQEGKYLARWDLPTWPFTALFLQRNRKFPQAEEYGMGDDFYSALNLAADEVIPGWDLTLHTSPKKDAYLVVLSHKIGGSPLVVDVVASDEAGVIYEGNLPPVQGPATISGLPVSYAPITEVLAGLSPLGTPLKSDSRLGNLLRRVAFSSMRGGQGGGDCGCPCCGTAQCSSQCYCWNCGWACSGGCTPWCCYPYFGEGCICSPQISCALCC
jgi:hypothetical protein